MSDAMSLELLLAPLAEDDPAGPDLEYDSEFLALEREVAARPERAIGDAVLPAEEPDWEKVQELALALWRRTRDLRVAMHLSNAWLQLRGLPGFADGVALIHGLIDRHWDAVHPQLDADDDDDPTARVNAVIGLGDPLAILGRVRLMPFVSSPRLGRFSLRDLRAANGTLKLAEDQTVPSISEIEACCQDCSLEQLQEADTAIAAALEQARGLDQQLTEHLGTAAPDLKPLLQDLAELQRFVQPHRQAREGVGESAEDNAADAGEPGVAGELVPRQSVRAGINGPADVVRQLDQICEYYAAKEPSSPVPLLLRRARKLVGLDFAALLENLVPDALDELARVTGPREEE